ncbi:hypothetical protein MIND_01395500 [Mycena indigotica]|uniref:Uncharacterized protein n=1 Tax=Mycena indigotica TaxID=2126181 RepID=A0A8H6RZA3_9AGAR|nr:uncharacterized protein MIND_01395500 [Mycena indigotica]KAF7289335.1 hypothetical protein MIND_01395500 [Mycena indigotica]
MIIDDDSSSPKAASYRHPTALDVEAGPPPYSDTPNAAADVPLLSSLPNEDSDRRRRKGRKQQRRRKWLMIIFASVLLNVLLVVALVRVLRREDEGLEFEHHWEKQMASPLLPSSHVDSQDMETEPEHEEVPPSQQAEGFGIGRKGGSSRGRSRRRGEGYRNRGSR